MKKVGRKFLLNLLLVVAVIAGVFASREPWQVYGAEREKTNEQLAIMKSSEKKREELLREEARANSTIGREEIARSQGWLKPGEKAVGEAGK